jgi:hypothetical protein
MTFAERNDKFWPVGTAFAIAPDTYVSAAHVLQMALGGQAGPPRLRDSAGKTYPIERVLKFSLHQDFVVFSVPATGRKGLATSRATRLDQPVFVVGSALGEGVDIRGGLLSSMTPEDQDGRWKWLRYSAAESPGDSGGPLLDAAGRVIGVVIGKFEREGLNYALPIEHVLNAGNEARIDMLAPLRVPVLRDSIVANHDVTIPLPLALDEFDRRFKSEFLKSYRAWRQRLLEEHADELFPKGRTEKLLVSVESAYCPMLIAQSKERIWEPAGSRRRPRICRTTSRFASGCRLASTHSGLRAESPRTRGFTLIDTQPWTCCCPASDTRANSALNP